MSERPLECGECKKKAAVTYKEITLQSIICTEMCEDCPILKAKLHGDSSPSNDKMSTLCCGRCGTTLESVQTGQAVGCAECYVVFADTIAKGLIAAFAIPSSQKLQTLHIGKSPKQASSPALSSKLASLHEALNEALKKENYEQAALLRDQIKSITEKL